jgi:hypothetical protein
MCILCPRRYAEPIVPNYKVSRLFFSLRYVRTSVRKYCILYTGTRYLPCNNCIGLKNTGLKADGVRFTAT